MPGTDDLSGLALHSELEEWQRSGIPPGDPTHDVGMLRQARLEMKDGVMYYPDELHQAIGVRPFGKRPVARALPLSP